MVVIGIILLMLDTFTFDKDDTNPTAKNPELFIYTKYIYRTKWEKFFIGDCGKFLI